MFALPTRYNAYAFRPARRFVIPSCHSPADVFSDRSPAPLVPTLHWSARGRFDRNKALWASFVLETPAGKLYIVCDSG